MWTHLFLNIYFFLSLDQQKKEYIYIYIYIYIIVRFYHASNFFTMKLVLTDDHKNDNNSFGG